MKIDLASIRTVVVHENGPANACPDGTAAAVLAHDAIPRASIVFASHEALRALRPDHGMLFADICPPRERAREFVEAGAYVLDHHAHQRDVVELFGERGTYAGSPGVSGAVLVFAHVWLPPVRDQPAYGPSIANAREFARLAGVRDTWQRDAGPASWQEASAQAEALRFWPWARLALLRDPFGASWRDLGKLLEVGHVLAEKRQASARASAARAVRMTLETSRRTRVAAVPTLETSDAAELVEDADVFAGFSYAAPEGDPQGRPLMKLSLRSRTGYDVGAFAAWLGGGGHRAAAGATFPMPDGNPFAAIRGLLTDFESGGEPAAR